MLASALGQIQEEEEKEPMNCPGYIRGRILCGMLAGRGECKRSGFFSKSGGVRNFFFAQRQNKKGTAHIMHPPTNNGEKQGQCERGKGRLFLFPRHHAVPPTAGGELTFVQRHVSLLTYRNLRKSPAAAPLTRIKSPDFFSHHPFWRKNRCRRAVG